MHRKCLVVINATASVLFSLLVMPVSATVVVEMNIQQGPDAVNDAGIVHMKLFDQLTPETVGNFLNYVNDGDYANSFFHRSLANFVIQGGGFLYDSPNTFSSLPVDQIIVDGISVDKTVVNEFSKSNTLGTIAMAKRGGNPDSATNQWFVNLADNSSNLDNQNGGFTVFGEVIGTSMNVIESMAAVPSYGKIDINTAFSDIPLVNYTNGDDINFSNLVGITAVDERFSIVTTFGSGSTVVVGNSLEPEDVDFGTIMVGSVVAAIVTIENKHIDILQIGSIANIDALQIPYQISTNECENASLVTNESCNIIVSFTPVTEAVFRDSVNIEFASINLSYTLDIHGEGSITPVNSNIVLSKRSVAFNEIELYDFMLNPPPEVISIIISNEGSLPLTLMPFTVMGEYKLDTNNCLVTKNPIQPGDSCDLEVGIFPESAGDKLGELTINSDDPDEPFITVPITGSGSLDNDRILTAIEDLAPNGGDGNNDNIQDSEQNNVISIAVADGSYATIIISEGEKFLDFTTLDKSQLINPPGENQLGTVLQFVHDFNQPSFGIGVTEIGIVLPENVNVETYFMYGATSENTNPHWYEFMFDGLTGAQIFNNLDFTSPSGKTIKRTIIKLIFVDSLRGDSDLTVNGEISVQGAHVKSKSSSSSDKGSSGSFDMVLFFIFLITSFCFRKKGLSK